jgi:hypothetical protein
MEKIMKTLSIILLYTLPLYCGKVGFQPDPACCPACCPARDKSKKGSAAIR